MHPLRNRQSQRLSGYDYSRNGLYFITIVCQDRDERFGEIIDGEMFLNDAGRMVESVWKTTIDSHGHITSDSFVIMPNHFHCIIKIVGADSISARDPISARDNNDIISPNGTRDNTRAEMDSAPTARVSVSDIIQTFKRYTTIRYIKGVKLGLVPPFRKRLWQRNYYDHIIRNEKDFEIIEQYIQNNPQSWEDDRLRKRDGLMEERAEYEEDWRNWL